jgi:hypothetical protein
MNARCIYDGPGLRVEVHPNVIDPGEQILRLQLRGNLLRYVAGGDADWREADFAYDVGVAMAQAIQLDATPLPPDPERDARNAAAAERFQPPT